MASCPKCNATISDADQECSSCGILFTKWKEREDNVASGNLNRYSSLANATSSGFNWTILIIVCVLIIGIMFYLKQKAIE